MNEIIKIEDIQNQIFTIRGFQVMIDRDLAEMYGVETRRLNEQVRRNIERFPKEFMFQLTKEEMENWKSQIATSNKVKMGVRKLPLVFTKQKTIVKTLKKKKDNLVSNEKIRLQKLQSLKTALMQDLLSGKKRVNSLITDGEL